MIGSRTWMPFAAITTAACLVATGLLLVPAGDSTHIDPTEIQIKCELSENENDALVDVRALEYRHLGNESGDIPVNCGGHKGHHTYFLGGVAKVTHFAGRILTVEQERSPQLDIESLAANFTELPRGGGVVDYGGVTIEASTDGLAWTVVAEVAYNLTDPTCSQPGNEVNCLQLICSAPQCEGSFLGIADRQGIDLDFSFDPHVDALFWRIAQPKSTLQGLAGYLEFSQGTLTVSATGSDLAIGVPDSVRTLTCANDILEDFFDTHPCWFGLLATEPIVLLESGSNLHTYYVGPSTLTRITGEATLLPYRAPGCGTLSPTFSARIEVSATGDADWVVVDRFTGLHGVPTLFDTGTIDEEARFVRIASDGCNPPNPKAKSIVFDSTITITGTLPG